MDISFSLRSMKGHVKNAMIHNPTLSAENDYAPKFHVFWSSAFGCAEERSQSIVFNMYYKNFQYVAFCDVYYSQIIPIFLCKDLIISINFSQLIKQLIMRRIKVSPISIAQLDLGSWVFFKAFSHKYIDIRRK